LDLIQILESKYPGHLNQTGIVGTAQILCA